METLISLGAVWFAAAAAITAGLCHAASTEEPFRLDVDPRTVVRH